MPKYIDTEGGIMGEKKEGFKIDQLDKVNKALDTGLAILDKIIGMKKYRETEKTDTSSPAQQISTKTEKEISNLPKPEIKIDDDLAFDNLVELIKNIPNEVKEKSVKESLEELEKNKEFVKPQLSTFIKSCVRII